jgi:hypothetical protein
VTYQALCRNSHGYLHSRFQQGKSQLEIDESIVVKVLPSHGMPKLHTAPRSALIKNTFEGEKRSAITAK